MEWSVEISALLLLNFIQFFYSVSFLLALLQSIPFLSRLTVDLAFGSCPFFILHIEMHEAVFGSFSLYRHTSNENRFKL